MINILLIEHTFSLRVRRSLFLWSKCSISTSSIMRDHRNAQPTSPHPEGLRFPFCPRCFMIRLGGDLGAEPR
jgi:hypothetical protein